MNPRLLIAALCLLLTSACSRITQENYEKLKSGMTYEEAEQILGRPTQCSETLGIKGCSWGDEQHNINANFVGGKAILFASENIR